MFQSSHNQLHTIMDRCEDLKAQPRPQKIDPRVDPLSPQYKHLTPTRMKVKLDKTLPITDKEYIRSVSRNASPDLKIVPGTNANLLEAATPTLPKPKRIFKPELHDMLNDAELEN